MANVGVTTATSLCHWGAFDATVEGGRLIKTEPWPGGGADPGMIGAWPQLVYADTRIDRPHVRAGWLRDRHGSDGHARGREDMIPVDWDEALSLVAGELVRIRDDHGHPAVFGGSYGWSSAGRLHHARTQLRRFLGAFGGFTDQIGNYSWGAAHVLLPHVLGNYDAVSGAATSWQTIIDHTDTLVAFGGLNPKNWRITSGGAGFHRMADQLRRAKEHGTAIVLVSPMADDIPADVDAQWLAPRPNTDTALMLALCHTVLTRGRADRAFLDRYCHGVEPFLAYLRGDHDNQPKSCAWAAQICDLPVAEIEQLADKLMTGRVMLTASWSLQRAHHGEQPFWALIALAAMLGQIGLPGGGFTFGYGSVNAVGQDARSGFIPAMHTLGNPADSAIPVARFVDMLEQPGATIPFNGREITFPDVKLVYWAGGNPYHHTQDLFRLSRAWAKPETIIVHEPWWTATARRADIVLPATTSAERNDIGGSSCDPNVFFMPQLIAPVEQARDDREILTDLADRLGCDEAFNEGRSEETWLRHLWSRTEATAHRQGIAAPDFETLRDMNVWSVPAPDEPEVYLDAFRAEPRQHALGTKSGKIELSSEVIAGFGYGDAPGHPAWLAPEEWLGDADEDALALLTRQPARYLHSQLAQVATPDAPQESRILLHPEDGARRAIADGDVVSVSSKRGACRAIAQLTEVCRPGVAAMETGPWFDGDGDKEFDRGGNPNAVTRNTATSALSQACAAQSCLVLVEKFVGHGD